MNLFLSRYVRKSLTSLFTNYKHISLRRLRRQFQGTHFQLYQHKPILILPAIRQTPQSSQNG